MDKTMHMLSVITAAVDNGLKIDETDSLDSIYGQAWDWLLEEEPAGHFYEHCEFNSGNQQSYTFVDPSGYEHSEWGEIFDHGKDGDYLDPDLKPVEWYQIPADRKGYAYVFDRVVCSDGRVAYLYDYYD